MSKLNAVKVALSKLIVAKKVDNWSLWEGEYEGDEAYIVVVRKNVKPRVVSYTKDGKPKRIGILGGINEYQSRRRIEQIHGSLTFSISRDLENGTPIEDYGDDTEF